MTKCVIRIEAPHKCSLVLVCCMSPSQICVLLNEAHPTLSLCVQDGKTVIMYAIRGGNLAIVQSLIDAGCNVNAVTKVLAAEVFADTYF